MGLKEEIVDRKEYNGFYLIIYHYRRLFYLNKS